MGGGVEERTRSFASRAHSRTATVPRIPADDAATAASWRRPTVRVTTRSASAISRNAAAIEAGADLARPTPRPDRGSSTDTASCTSWSARASAPAEAYAHANHEASEASEQASADRPAASATDRPSSSAETAENHSATDASAEIAAMTARRWS